MLYKINQIQIHTEPSLVQMFQNSDILHTHLLYKDLHLHLRNYHEMDNLPIGMQLDLLIYHMESHHQLIHQLLRFLLRYRLPIHR